MKRNSTWLPISGSGRVRWIPSTIAISTILSVGLFDCRTVLGCQAESPVKVQSGANPDRDAVQKKHALQVRALERKQEIMTFVEKHDPQVKSLLAMIETKRPEQFREALASLSREVDRLTTLQARDPQRFELELKLWQNSKRIQIASAKISIRGESPELREELRKLVANRNELRIEAIELELARSRDRAEKLNQQLAKAKSLTAGDLDRQLEQVFVKAKKSNRGDLKKKRGEDLDAGKPRKTDD